MNTEEQNKPQTSTLSPNHQRFIDEYFRQNLNGNLAYSICYPNASYESARREASRLLTKVDIQNAISLKFQTLQKRNDVQIDEIISDLKGLVKSCKEDGDRHHLLKSLDQLSKLLGLYAPKKVEHTNVQPIQINILPPAQSKIQPIRIGKIQNKLDETGDILDTEEPD